MNVIAILAEALHRTLAVVCRDAGGNRRQPRQAPCCALRRRRGGETQARQPGMGAAATTILSRSPAPAAGIISQARNRLRHYPAHQRLRHPAPGHRLGQHVVSAGGCAATC